MRWIATLIALAIAATGCTMIEENASLRSQNERLGKEAIAEKMRADRLQRDLDYARKHPETLRTPAAKTAAAQPAATRAAGASKAAAGGKKSGGMVLGEKDVAVAAQAGAQAEVKRLNGMIAAVQEAYLTLGPDTDKYATAYNEMYDAVDQSRKTVSLFEEVVAPALDPMPAPPSEGAQTRYEAARAEEARRAEDAQRAQEAAVQKREAAKEKQAEIKASAEALGAVLGKTSASRPAAAPPAPKGGAK